MHGEPQRCRRPAWTTSPPKPTTIPLLAAKLRVMLPHLGMAPTALDRAWPVRVEGAAPVEEPMHGLDQTVLIDLTGGDAGLGKAILNDYLESTHADMVRLRAALESQDVDEVQAPAHRMKGASAYRRGVRGPRAVSASSRSRPWDRTAGTWRR